MSIDLMPWMIVWAMATTGVVILAIWRNLLSLHDLAGMHIEKEQASDAQAEAQLARKIARIDLWGKILTVASGVLIAGIGLVWLYNGLRP